MSFDCNREQRFAKMRLQQNVDRDVAEAMRRIHEYTATELEEVRLGKRESPRERDLRLAREVFRELGRTMRSATDTILEGLQVVGNAVAGFSEGFEEKK